MADGGFPKAWRHYIETTTIVDVEITRKRLVVDMGEMSGQLVLSPSAREIIVGASDKIRAYFGSFTLTSPRGDNSLRERALLSVDAMATSLVDVEKKEVGF